MKYAVICKTTKSKELIDVITFDAVNEADVFYQIGKLNREIGNFIKIKEEFKILTLDDFFNICHVKQLYKWDNIKDIVK